MSLTSIKQMIIDRSHKTENNKMVDCPHTIQFNNISLAFGHGDKTNYDYWFHSQQIAPVCDCGQLLSDILF